MMDLTLQFFLALFATLGFSIIFTVPAKCMVPCVVVGGLGWVVYQIVMFYQQSPILACFLAACLVGLLSDICSHIFKDASTIFIIPGILCLVPGSNIFKTMEALLRHDVSNTASIGSETLLMAGAIATGLLVIGAVSRVVLAVIKKTMKKVI